MERVLLFSDNEEIFETTKVFIGDEYELAWCTYNLLEQNKYSSCDIVIMYFDEMMTREGPYESISRVKGRLGHSTLILAVVEGGTPREILQILEAGVFDYLSAKNLHECKSKIEAIGLWKWYLSKYGDRIER